MEEEITDKFDHEYGTQETALQKAHRVMTEKRANGEEIIRLTPIEKAKLKPTSLRLAINAKCWDCCCEQRVEITRCQITDCSLWPVRPYQKSVDDETEDDNG